MNRDDIMSLFHLKKAIELVCMEKANTNDQITEEEKKEKEKKTEMLKSLVQKLLPNHFCAKMLVHMMYVKPDRSTEQLEGLLRELSTSNDWWNYYARNTRSMLRFCCDDLPADYRRCLLYLSIFPPGCEMRRTSLVRRWVAEGLIVNRAGLSALDAAERCFSALFDRGLLRVKERGTDGKVKIFTIPDQVRDFITETARADNFADTSNLPPGLARYLSVRNGISTLQQVRRPKHRDICTNILRSICWPDDGVPAAQESDPSRDIVELLGSLPALERQWLLKVLDLEGCTGLQKHHLKIICQIPELRYLSLRSTDVNELPKEIHKLQNLETLDIRQTKV